MYSSTKPPIKQFKLIIINVEMRLQFKHQLKHDGKMEKLQGK